MIMMSLKNLLCHVKKMMKNYFISNEFHCELWYERKVIVIINSSSECLWVQMCNIRAIAMASSHWHQLKYFSVHSHFSQLYFFYRHPSIWQFRIKRHIMHAGDGFKIQLESRLWLANIIIYEHRQRRHHVDRDRWWHL